MENKAQLWSSNLASGGVAYGGNKLSLVYYLFL